jgi:glutamine amidotransferase
VRAHRRRKTVVIASHAVRPEGWLEIPNDRAIAVGRDLGIQHLPI